MTPDEQQLLKGLFDRVRTQGAVPRDPQAEAFIAEAVRALPYAPYLLTQTVIVQDHALQAANERLQQLEQQVQELEQTQRTPAPASGSFLGNAARSLFGDGHYGAAQPSSAPSVPQSGPWGRSAPAYGAPPSPAWGSAAGQQAPPAPPPWSSPQAGWSGQPGPAASGGGFLHGALGAAAGVAGGVLLADSIRGLFGGGGNAYGMASGFGGGLMNPMGGGLGGGMGNAMGGSETVINNYYDTNDQNDVVAPATDIQDTTIDDPGWSNGDDNSGGSFDV